MKYRLGIDLGTNSLGWAAIQLSDTLEPRQLVDMGVRIFSDARNPKDKSSNAAQRREPRGARRNRDRKLARGRAMQHVLRDTGLWPEDVAHSKSLEAFDPWVLRTRALDEQLDLFQVGRALFHLQQRRGFKSNRKTDGVEDGAMFEAIEIARQKMTHANVHTLGELFGKPRLAQLASNKKAAYGNRAPLPQARVRARMTGSKMSYEYYPDRAMILDEFDQIWQTQAAFHPNVMTSDARDKIRHVIEFQRPLKAQRAGKCTFLHEEPRAPKALPSSQYARILQDINNLRVGAVGKTAKELTKDERLVVLDFLCIPSSKTARRTFSQIRKKLGIPASQRFNLESEKRDYLAGDTTAATLMQDASWGADWHSMERSAQDEIITKLVDAEQPEDFVPWVMDTHNLDEERATRVFYTRLPDGYGKLSHAALERLIPHLEEGIQYDEAARIEFGDHRGLGDGVIYEDGLPYYGEVLSRHTAFERDNPKNDEERFGRVANPTVHVALNQLQKVINDLIKRWGPPEQIVLELARDLPLSDRGLRELESLQTKNQKKNDDRREELEKLRVANTYENRLKLRLYEEAIDAFGGTAVCVFSGDAISKTDLFSPNVEIEHILPLSRTLDDSFANKVLATREANRVKKNQSPYEAFGTSPGRYDWEAISLRAASLPKQKSWRFAPDAMDQWAERGGDFLDRQLNDTRYIARLGKTFVEAIYGGQGVSGQERRVWAVPGRLTSDLRHHAGFNTLTGLRGGNRKDRTDHRHHAIDALVVALTDQSMIQRTARLSKAEERADYHDIMAEMAEPIKRYRSSAEDRLSKLVVSHKPDHGFQDAMHMETAYGITDIIDDKKQRLLVTRKPLSSMTKPSDIEAIVDERIRNHLLQETAGLGGKAFNNALTDAGERMTPPVRRVRVSTMMKDTSFITVRHGDNQQHTKAYKGGSNYCYDIYVDKKGKWAGDVITTFQAYQRSQGNPDWMRKFTRENGDPLIMRIRKGDMLEIDGPSGTRRIVKVYKMSPGMINMADHFEANESKRIDAKELERTQKSPGALQKVNAIRVTVSPSGKVKRHKA